MKQAVTSHFHLPLSNKKNKMKKYLIIILSIVMLLAIVTGCKKSNTPKKDYTTSIKDKTWSGMITYTGETGEYFSIYFNADNSLIWSQLSGNLLGQWTIDGNHLSMSFSGSTAVIKADISTDDKFSNISDNTTSFEVNNGELIAYPNLVLDNTTWKGSIYKNGGAVNQQLNFLPGLKVGIKIGNTSFGPYAYTRSASGAVIRVSLGGTYPFFGVITSAIGMKGSDGDTDYPWQAIKE
jgi:hypothetical protein